MPSLPVRFLRRKTDPFKLLQGLRPDHLRDGLVVHVGAHLAQERFAYDEAGVREVHWLEASGPVHERLVRLLADHAPVSATRHHAHHALLSDTEGAEVELNVFSNDGMSSSIFHSTEALRGRWPHLRETGASETIRTTTLDWFWSQELNAAPIALLVVDVQGAEALVLKGAGDTLSNTGAVICEVSTVAYYEGGALFGEIRQLLAKAGFEPQSTPRRHGDMLFLPARRRRHT